MFSHPVLRSSHHRRTLPALFAAVLLAGTALVGCSSTENTEGDDATATTADTTGASGNVTEGFPVSVTFDPYDPVTIDTEPERIVSLSPTTTEMLFAVGAGDKVVAVDDNSNYPEEAPLMEGLSGYTPNVESVLDYDPDLVVLMTSTGGIVEGLNAAGVTVLVVPSPVDLEGTYEQIELLGEATGNTDQAVELVEEMKGDIAEAVASVPQELKDAGLTYYHELGSTYHTVSDATYLGQIYKAFGLRSIAPDNDDYPQLTSEAVVAANPDIIFLANTRAEDMDAETVASRPGWETIDAVANDQVINLDDDIASRWGPRVSDLVEQIADVLNERILPNVGTSAGSALVN